MYNLQESSTYKAIDIEINKETNLYYKGYLIEDIKKQAKVIFGDDIEINIKSIESDYLKISEEKKALYFLPVGFSSDTRVAYIKDVKENNNEFVITIYHTDVANLNIPEEDGIEIYTKDTYNRLLNNDSSYTDTLLTILYKDYENSEIDVIRAIEENKDKIPIVEYTLKKIDNNDDKYYVSKIVKNY